LTARTARLNTETRQAIHIELVSSYATIGCHPDGVDAVYMSELAPAGMLFMELMGHR